jgi:hypothetical protein
MNDNHEFRPNSQDAMFARILEKLDDLKADTREIRTDQATISERVSVIEREKWFVRGVTATIGVIAGGVWTWISGGSGK